MRRGSLVVVTKKPMSFVDSELGFRRRPRPGFTFGFLRRPPHLVSVMVSDSCLISLNTFGRTFPYDVRFRPESFRTTLPLPFRCRAVPSSLGTRVSFTLLPYHSLGAGMRW